MNAKVKSDTDLKKRIDRFLRRERFRDKKLDFLLTQVSEGSDLYLFGGALRDIALFGIDGLESDLDFVFVDPELNIPTIIQELPSRKNRFGGYRITSDHWFIDLWNAEDTWAFREGYRTYRDISSLLATTMTNWEAILYGLRERRLVHHDSYFDSLNAGYLDTVLAENPSPEGMFVKLVRAYVSKDAVRFSTKAAAYLREGLRRFPYEVIYRYEVSHYKRRYIDSSVYRYLKNHEGIEERSLLPLDLVDSKGTIPLPLFEQHSRHPKT